MGFKNQRPEKWVEHECLLWMRSQGWDVNIFDSKATYSKALKMYVKNRYMPTGVSDCCGNMKNGIAVYVEFKAPGRLAGFWNKDNIDQQSFLLAKINSNAFAVVVDSAERLSQIYNDYVKVRADYLNPETTKEFLIKSLPKKPSAPKVKEPTP